MNYIIHNAAGEVLRTVSCDPSMIDIQLSTGESYIEGTTNDELQYVLNGKPVNKQVIPATVNKLNITADGVDSIIIDNLPSPSTVIIDSQSIEVLDGLLEFTLDQPGNFTVTCAGFPYSPVDFEVVAS